MTITYWSSSKLDEFIQNSLSKKDFIHPKGSWTIEEKESIVAQLIGLLKACSDDTRVLVAMRILAREVQGSEQLFSREV
jgi:hypothetical protein